MFLKEYYCCIVFTWQPHRFDQNAHANPFVNCILHLTVLNRALLSEYNIIRLGFQYCLSLTGAYIIPFYFEEQFQIYAVLLLFH